MNIIKIYIEDNHSCLGVRAQRVHSDDDEAISFSAFDLCDFPDDAAIGRELFDAHDYVRAIELGMELARRGYDGIEIREARVALE